MPKTARIRKEAAPPVAIPEARLTDREEYRAERARLNQLLEQRDALNEKLDALRARRRDAASVEGQTPAKVDARADLDAEQAALRTALEAVADRIVAQRDRADRARQRAARLAAEEFRSGAASQEAAEPDGGLARAVLHSRVLELRCEAETLHGREAVLRGRIAAATARGSNPSELTRRWRAVRDRLAGLRAAVSYLEELTAAPTLRARGNLAPHTPQARED
jgi:chromosome segregation ATPase